MDTIATAFEPLRARAAKAPGARDRLSVRDHTREVEIGAFSSERGVTQRIRFNVVLEVSDAAAALNDDVDTVLSYETIVEAIDAALEAERLNLLETLAERVAALCLADPRAVRVFVRIEKLDRIPGALGVEIARRRQGPEAAGPRSAGAPARRARIVHLAPDLLRGDAGDAWLAAVASFGGPVVVTLGPATPEPPAAAEGALRAGLLAIDAAAWRLADRDPGLTVVAARVRLDRALGAGRPAVWAPSRMLLDAAPRPRLDASRPAALAAWLAGAVGAEALILAGDAPDVDPAAVEAAPDLAPGVTLRRAAVPADLAG